MQIIQVQQNARCGKQSILDSDKPFHSARILLIAAADEKKKTNDAG